MGAAPGGAVRDELAFSTACGYPRVACRTGRGRKRLERRALQCGGAAVRRWGPWGRGGLVGGAALLPLFPGHLPERPAVVPVQAALGAGDVDDVAGLDVLVEPDGVLGRLPDASVADVGVAQSVGVARSLVQVFAAVGDAHRVVDEFLVV